MARCPESHAGIPPRVRHADQRDGGIARISLFLAPHGSSRPRPPVEVEEMTVGIAERERGVIVPDLH